MLLVNLVLRIVRAEMNIVHCSLKVIFSPQTKMSVTLLEVRVTWTQSASTRMVRFNVNAMPDLLAMDSVAKEVGSSVNVAKEYPSS